jgi:Tfp pilus assembly pilus retraction ATPase PilT
MTEKKSITITGGDLRDSTSGIGTVTSNRGAGTSTTLADLRTALDTHAEGIIAVIDLFS